MVQFLLTWAEDRATVGTDPSADPGAKTEGAAQPAALSFPPSGLAPKRYIPGGLGEDPPGSRTYQAITSVPSLASFYQVLHERLAVTVSITGSLAAVLVVRGRTPKHPFVIYVGLRPTFRSHGPGTEYSFATAPRQRVVSISRTLGFSFEFLVRAPSPFANTD